MRVARRNVSPKMTFSIKSAIKNAMCHMKGSFDAIYTGQLEIVINSILDV